MIARLALPSAQPRIVALIYAVFAAVFVLLLAVELPPIQGPDEGAHYVRADQVSRGQLIAYRVNAGASGGVIDLGIMQAINRFYPVALSLEARVSRPMYAPIAWGEAGQWSFPNTALYPPFFYLPAAGAIRVGKAVGIDVLHTDMIARIGSGLVSVAVASVAIALSGPACLWLFAVLLLPSSAGLMGSLTQDGPMLASAALAAALAVRLRDPGVRAWRVQLVLLCVLLALLGMSRPPYAAMAVLPLVTRAPPRSARWAGCFVVVGATLAWWIYCKIRIFTNVDQSGAADAGAQLYFLLTHPWRIPGLMADTLSLSFEREYAGFFITTFAKPGPYHVAAWWMLAVAGLSAYLRGAGATRRHLGMVGLGVVTATAGIFAVQYLTWTPVGGDVIRGVLGRYFLPLALLLAAGFVGPLTKNSRGADLLAIPVLIFPAASIVLTLHSLIIRYYI